MNYIENMPVAAKAIADLREAVGWNRMEKSFGNPAMTSYYHIAACDGERLVGYVDCVSNGVTDAYIQDLMVHPDYQHKGIGRELMQHTLARLRRDGIYMVSVIYGDAELQRYYEDFGFTTMLCGQTELRPGCD